MNLAEQMFKIANEINKPKISEWVLKEIEKATRKGEYHLLLDLHELTPLDIDGLKLEGFTISEYYNRSWGLEDQWKISWDLKDSEVR